MVAAGIFGFDEEGKPTEGKENESTPGVAFQTPKRQILQSANEKKAEDIRQKYEQEKKIVQDLARQKELFLNDEFTANKNLLELEGQRAQISTNQYQQEKLFLDLANNRQQIKAKTAILEYEALKQLELSSAEEKTQAKQLYDEKIKYIQKTYEIEISNNRKLDEMRISNLDNEIKRQQSWLFGWTNALKRYAEESEKASNRGAQAFNIVMAGMETALSNFVETGKLKFKDFVGDVVKQLLYMQLKAQATSLFNSLFGGAKGFLGSLFLNKNQSAVGTGFPMAASGGNINSPTIVGENGAELFVPRTPGTIIPNGAWQSQMQTSSGITVNGNYIANMSAIDTQSGMQFLAKNKNTIWAAYQSANRGVPISR
jgi:lambda family phage tail tape measure protein